MLVSEAPGVLEAVEVPGALEAARTAARTTVLREGDASRLGEAEAGDQPGRRT